MTGQEVIDFIQQNHLEDAKVVVSATMYYPGDHDCRQTEEVEISEGREYGGGKTVKFYVDSSLY